MQQMFDPYFTTKDSGHGFGLSVVLGIVQSHQASMIINSRVGEGTTATLLFPAYGSSVEDTGEFRIPGSSASSRVSLRRILVIDDEDLVRTPMAEMLRLLNWQVDDVNNGQEALELIESGATFAVVIVDYRMPGMNGQETLRALREAGCESPAVLCSGYIAEADQQSALEDFDGFLPKPFRREQLEETLRNVIAS